MKNLLMGRRTCALPIMHRCGGGGGASCRRRPAAGHPAVTLVDQNIRVDTLFRPVIFPLNN
jgi:hypothetical protein